jgi:hypothetical protein
VAGSDDGSVAVWSCAARTQLFTLKLPEVASLRTFGFQSLNDKEVTISPVRQFLWLSAGRLRTAGELQDKNELLIVNSNGNVFRLGILDSGERVVQEVPWLGHVEDMLAISTNSQGHFARFDGGTLSRWADVRNDCVPSKQSFPRRLRKRQAHERFGFSADSETIDCTAWSAALTANRAYCGYDDGCICEWDIGPSPSTSPILLRETCRVSESLITHLAYNSTYRLPVIAAADESGQLFWGNSVSTLAKRARTSGRILSLAVATRSCSGLAMPVSVVATEQQDVIGFAFEGKELFRIRFNSSKISAMACSSDATMAAIGFEDGNVLVVPIPASPESSYRRELSSSGESQGQLF